MVEADILLRAAEAGDFDAIARVWRDSALSADLITAEEPSLAALRARIDVELRAGWGLSVAVAQDAIVAFLAIKQQQSALDQIFVAPATQGRAIGRTLLQAAKHAMPNGFTLRTAAANKRAHAFYEREGLRLIIESAQPNRAGAVCYYAWAPE